MKIIKGEKFVSLEEIARFLNEKQPDKKLQASAMGRVREGAYTPDPEARAVYDKLYREYLLLHDYFGRGANEVMHRLREL